MLNVRVKKALLTILTACLTVLMTIGAVLGFTPTPQTVKAATTDETSATWTLVTNASDLAVGDKVVIVAKNAKVALSTTQNKNNRGQTSVTISGSNVTITSTTQVLTLQTGKSAGTFAFQDTDGTDNGYLYAASSSSNYLRTETTLSANSSWNITITSAGVATIKATGSNTHNWLRYNSSNSLFSCYESGQGDVCIYKLVVCDHVEGKYVSNDDGTHKVMCKNEGCSYVFEEKIGCTLTTEYKSNNDGTHNYTTTCDVCDYKKSESNVGCNYDETNTCDCGYKTTKETCTVSFCVPSMEGISEVVSTTVEKGNTIPELPTADAPEGYTFEGWVAEQTISETRPDLFTAETEITEDMKLYALYKHEEGGIITKITDVSQLTKGMKVVITNADASLAMSTTQNPNNRGQTSIQNSTPGKIEFDNNVQRLTLEAGTVGGTFAFNTGSGYLYAASSSKNYLRTETTLSANSSWNIEIDSTGVATIIAQGTYTHNWLRYNSSSKIFSCYESGQGDVCLYTEGEATIVYTTLQFVSASLTLGEELTMNYKVAMDDAYAGAEMTFTMNGESVTVSANDELVDGLYVYSLQVAPQFMGENISAVLTLNGETLATKAEYSVKAYAEYLLNNEKSSDEVKQLASDLLHYGAAAQAYYAEKVEKEEQVAGEPVNNVEGILANKYAPSADDEYKLDTETLDEYPVYFTGANLNFSSLNTLYVTLSAYDENVKLVVDGTPVTLTGKTYSTGTLQATDFDKKFTFKLYYDNVLMQTLTYSVNAYAYEFGQAGKEGTMADLARALYNYGKSVEAYVAANNKQA